MAAASKRKAAGKKGPDTASIGTTKQQTVLSHVTQQRILAVFAQAFPVIDQNNDFKATLQEVKGHLFNRDFETAFGKQEYLDIYAVRWSAARALAYSDIFMREHRHAWFQSAPSKLSGGHRVEHNVPDLAYGIKTSDGNSVSYNITTNDAIKNTSSTAFRGTNTINVACIGGGAGAEIAALATVSAEKNLDCHLNVYAIDVANWESQVTRLYATLSTQPPISSFASQAVKDANKAFIDTDQFSVTFLRRDILEFSSQPRPRESPAPGANPDSLLDSSEEKMSDSPLEFFSTINLVTLMFTLNELFATSMAKTTTFLLHLSDVMPQDSYLVVVDSPGSYSEIKLGKTGEPKRYPMKWLLDHTLLDVAGKDRWSKIEDEDSLWFRLDNRGKSLGYLVDLENCRYQIHVYRKR